MRLTILGKDGEKKVIVPFAVNSQILAGIALLGEAAGLEQADGGGVVRQTGRLDAVQGEVVESKRQQREHRFACEGNLGAHGR